MLKIQTCICADKVPVGDLIVFELSCYSLDKPIILQCINSVELKNKYIYFLKIHIPVRD